MTNIWLLFKISFINSFNINKFKRRFNNGKGSVRILLPISVIIIYLVIAIISFLYMMLFTMIFKETGNLDLILIIGIIMGIILTFTMTITKANAFLFASKDFDFLMAMPIKSSHVIISKLLYLIVYNYIFFSIVYFPTLICYALYAPTGIIFWILGVITFIVTPLLPIAVCSAFSFIVGMFTSKLKYKNMILTIFFILIFAGFMTLYLLSTSSSDPTAMYEGMANVLLKMYPPADWAVAGLLESDILNYLLFLVVSVIPFIIFVIVVAKVFVKANSRVNISYTRNNFKRTELKGKSQLIALLKKELRFYFSNSSYVLNTISTPLMSTIMLIVMSANLLQLGSGGIGDGTDLGQYNSLIILGMSVFFFGLTTTTASAISLEGKSFWILKSAPINVKTIFKAKLIINLIISVPFGILNGILGLVLLDFTVIDFIFYLLITFSIVFGMGIMGLHFNLIFPKFDWTNPVKVVKSSTSVFMTMIIGFLLLIVEVVSMVIAFMFLESLLLVYILIMLISVGFLAVSIILLNTRGIARYNRLSA